MRAAARQRNHARTSALLSTIADDPDLTARPRELALLLQEIGGYFQGLEMDQEVLGLFDLAVGRFPTWPFGHYHRGLARLFVGQFDGGSDDLITAASLAPHYQDAARSAALLRAGRQGSVPLELAVQLVLMQSDPQTVARVPRYLEELAADHPPLQVARLLLARHLLQQAQDPLDEVTALPLLEQVVDSPHADLLSAAEARFLLATQFSHPSPAVVQRLLQEACGIFPDCVWGVLSRLALQRRLPSGPLQWDFDPDGTLEIEVIDEGGQVRPLWP